MATLPLIWPPVPTIMDPVCLDFAIFHLVSLNILNELLCLINQETNMVIFKKKFPPLVFENKTKIMIFETGCHFFGHLI